MNVFCFSSEDNTNVAAAIGSERWAYKKKQKSHGIIKPGDYIMLYSRQSGCIECIGVVLTKPEVNVEVRDLWKETFFNPFKFKVIAKKAVSLDEIKQILGTDANLNEYLSIFYPDAPAVISSEEVAKIINEMLKWKPFYLQLLWDYL